MVKEEGLKSAYELAMERLRAQDREQGVEEARPLTAEQRERIAQLRQDAKAKLAELEILHEKNLAGASDPEKLAEIEEHYKVDRSRIDSNLETAIGTVREQEA